MDEDRGGLTSFGKHWQMMKIIICQKQRATPLSGDLQKGDRDTGFLHPPHID